MVKTPEIDAITTAITALKSQIAALSKARQRAVKQRDYRENPATVERTRAYRAKYYRHVTKPKRSATRLAQRETP